MTDYPGYEDLPIHGFDLEPGEWWACLQPERPALNNTRASFDERCTKCYMAAHAAALAEGADKPVFDGPSDMPKGTAGDMLRRMAANHGAMT